MADHGKLLETVTKYPCTDIWNDSCSKSELEYAIANGAVGATTNPIIVTNVLKQEMPIWEETIRGLVRDNPCDTEDDIAWKLIETIGRERAKMLLPAFEKFHKRKGRLSMQTNPKFYRNAKKMAEQAIHFDSLGENIQVKIPVTEAGIAAIEEATYAGVSVNATVCFVVPQAIAVAEAVERGLARRRAEGLPCEHMSPVCTLMMGRYDDYLKRYVASCGQDIDPECLDWAGIAVFKKAYGIYKARGYRTRLLSAAYRNLEHWAQLVGGDCVMTIPHGWLVKIDECDREVVSRIDEPVDPRLIEELKKLPPFVAGYEEDGLKPSEFEGYGATRATLIDFLAGYDTLLKLIRGFMVTSLEQLP